MNKVVFADQTHITKPDAQGKWKDALKLMKASFLPQKLLIKGKNECIIYDNIVVGEVWLCSGQSNMQYKMQRHEHFVGPAKGEELGLAELNKTANPSIWVFNMDRDGTKHVEWNVADGQSLATTSAAGYFFGKSIQEKLYVPVGIIISAIGGFRIESWTRSDAYEFSQAFSEQFSKKKGRIDGFRPGNWHKTMIAPLVPFALKGFLWYHGETNCGIDDVKDIHPSYKWIVGERLSRIALAKNYGFSDMKWSGPRVKNIAYVGDSIIIRFDHTANGLKTNDRCRLAWFEILDENDVFFPALAEIIDWETLAVWPLRIKNPKAVRFGWRETAIPNLVNSEGLPAALFNTMS